MSLMYLVRHGETDANAAGLWQGSIDAPLNATGRAQAGAVAAALAREQTAGALPFAAVYTTPLQRARVTAEIMQQALGHPPLIVRPDLQEFALGAWEGLPYRALRDEKRFWERLASEANFAPPGGESGSQFGKRIIGAFSDILQRHPGEHDRAILVGHGGVFATLLSIYLDGHGRNWTAYTMANGAISVLAFTPEPNLLRLNDTAHLGEMAGAKWIDKVGS
ncbi:MAG: histidine phosphatase family protein [Chloroflexi bacterium]|nr:histidine phosphatase family protein [Chloroflexota bacterium]